MEFWFGRGISKEGLDSKTRLLLTLAGLTMQGAQADTPIRMTVRHLIEAGATKDEIAETIAREVGKPLWDAMGEAKALAGKVDLMLGEGAAVAVIESYEHAKARGATILAEILGSGLSGDAADIVTPTVEGPTQAIRNCLADAGLASDAIDYINAHGTGTQANDKTETKAIRMALGAAADAVSVSSTKSMHGHCLGGSSAIEMIACIGALREGIVPPTINFETPDPACDLNYTFNAPQVDITNDARPLILIHY